MTSHFQRLARKLSAKYQLKSNLSTSATAHVYLAEEVKTGRRVAIKVLREEQATTTAAARFLASFTSAAQMEHPNIVPLYGLGTADGVPYCVMPFIEGPSVRTRLRTGGRLPLDEIVQVCGDVCAALDYAHKRRIVHRDIKPEKIMLQPGRAMVLDFGTAMALEALDRRRTKSAPIARTPEYMSPEQAQGDSYIDGRSDIYSFACVVYEMIWGLPPFTGKASLVLPRHVSAEPMPLSCRLPGVPHGLSAAVVRALAKTPSDRFATAGAFAVAVRDGCNMPESCLASAIGPVERPVGRPPLPAIDTRQSA
jgi:eukaryotic-like serine/threonine-protein kinase